MGELFKGHGRGVVLSISLFVFSASIGWWIAQTTLRSIPLERVPASTDHAQYDPDLYANDSLEDLEREYQRQNPSAKRRLASKKASKPARENSTENVWFDVAGPSDLRLIAKEAEEKTGIPTRRARKVIITTSEFLWEEDERWMEVEVFPDRKLLLHLQRPSAYGVNHAILVGQVVGDPQSQVRITLQDALVSAFIRTKQSYFQVVSAGSQSHFIIEVDETRQSKRNAP